MRNNLVTIDKDSAAFYRTGSCGGCSSAGWKKDNHIVNNSIYVTVDTTASPIIDGPREDLLMVCQNNIAYNTVTATEELCPNADMKANNASRAAGQDVTMPARSCL